MNHLGMLLAAEQPTNGFWFPHDPWEILWGSLSFLIVVWLLWKFGNAPARKYFSGRTSGIEASLDEASVARTAAESDHDGIKAALADSDAEAARILEEARQAADALTVDIAARTERDVAAVYERAAIDLAATRSQTDAELSGELSRLAYGAAEQVVTEELGDASQQHLIDAYINNIGSQN